MTDIYKGLCLPLCLLVSSFALLLMGTSGDALARQEGPPISWERDVKSLGELPVLDLPEISRASLLAEDKSGGKHRPLQFAKPVTVSVAPPGSAKASDASTADAAQWERLGDGSRLWRQRVSCPGATDLNMGFSRYKLPKGATLHVYSESEDYYEGPYDHRDNEAHGQLWVPVVPGDKAVIELYVSASVEYEPELELSQVGCGFRGMFFPPEGGENRAVAKQGGCNIDVVCNDGDPWRNEIRSVARYAFSGSRFCTGTLINDVPGSFTPFFLSAAHCGVDASNAASVVVYWNFESPLCGALSGGSLSDNQSGAIFRAAKTDVDVMLLELDDDPAISSNVHFAGWDRSGVAPLSVVGIHHPNGDEKAISFNDDPLRSVNSCIGGGSGTHWEVDNWEDGTTEIGSSGSGIWDPSRRLVGVLSGGSASCANTTASDCYGKFSVGWDSGNSAANRLRDWLDPGNNGALSVDGKDFALGGDLAAATLPASRSVQINNQATAFATIVNGTRVAATDCGIAPLTAVPAAFSYQTTDPASNALIGTPDTPVDIRAGESQSFVFAFAPTAEIAPTDVQLIYDCANTQSAPITVGLNTLLLSASSTPVADVIALVATPTGNNIVDLEGNLGINAIAVAAINVGSQSTITASADTGTASLPVTLSICKSDAATGECLSAPNASVTTVIDADATATYSIFIAGTGNGTVPFDPARNRIFVRFRDGSGVPRGSTSVSVQTILP